MLTAVAECDAGNEAAFERIVAAHERLVFGTALRLLGNREDARDAAQEVFLRLYRNLARVDEARMGAWLYKVTVNVCRDAGRERRPVSELDAEHPSAAAGPDAGVVEADRRRLLANALRRLSEKERAAVVLRDLEGLSTREVAEAMGNTEATVRSHLSAARLKLKQYIEGMRRRP
ncbi:MAG TPA: sigma-70 family RNA polymerase sigma factor [Bryobacteraceae bacterium]|nr:sigma-70 family RNA polymerase sigma factor [Bryobacteraceae bacterium]